MSTEIKLPKLTYSDLLVHLGRTAGAVSRTVWKDGIDIEQPSHGIVALCEAYARAAVEDDRKGRVPMTKQQRDAMFAEVQRRANQLMDDGRYSFGGWFPIAVELIEAHYGIRPAGGEHG